MSMMSDYYNTTGEWKHIAGADDYNQAAYSISNPPCRIMDKMKLVRDKTGVQVVSMTTVYTDAAVNIDDLFNGRVVLSVKSMDSLEDTEGYEVNLV